MVSSVVRYPAVAGRFYPADPSSLLSDVNSFIQPRANASAALGCVAPHAGYMYSGHVAGAVYARLELPDRCILMCPNHTGMGRPLAIMSRGKWMTPLGELAIDADLADQLKDKFPLLEENAEAHRAEHGAEVHLPFLQALNPNITFVPIALGTGQFDILQALGLAMAGVISQQGCPILIIASSDMNHYENDAITRIKDHRAIERILALDPMGLFETVVRDDISMCGIGPTVVVLTAVLQLGATKAELVKYATSADVSGDKQRVVGYAGILVR